MNIKSKMEERAALWDKMQELRSAAQRAGRERFSRDEQRSWNEMESKLEGVTAEIESLQRQEADAKAFAVANPDHVRWSGEAGNLAAAGMDSREAKPLAREQRMADWVQARGLVREEERAMDFGRYVRGMATGEWRGADTERRAMSEGVQAGGGYLIPTLLSAQIIDLARNKAAVMRAGATVVPMENSVVNVAKWAGDPSAAWHSEAATISPSDATLGRVTLTATTLSTIVLVSRELLEDTIATGQSIGDELAQAFAAQFALAIDSAALAGTGTAPQPRGIRNTSGITVQPMGANGAAPTNFDFLVDAVGTLRDNNEEPSAVIYSPRTERELAKLKDSQNRYLAQPQILDGITRYATNQVSNTQTQGTSSGVASDAYVGDFSQLLVGFRANIGISASSPQVMQLNERYADTGQVGFLAWWRGDIQVARPKAFVDVQGIL